MSTLRDSLNKIGQKLEQKSESVQIPSYLPSAICRYYKKLGHLRFSCSILKKKKEKKKNNLEVGVTKHSFSSVVSDSLQPRELQHARPPCPSPTPRVHSNSCASSRWCHPAISSSVVPSPPAPNPSQHQSIFQWVNSLHEVAKILKFQLQHQSFQWTPRTDLL